MLCPKCFSKLVRTTDSRAKYGGRYVIRRRVCSNCHHVWHTYEVSEEEFNRLSNVENVKHGHWEKQIEYFGHSFKCSVCQECTIFTQDKPPKFCSKCGAKLDGEKQ